jgi:hypothetical protein
VKEHPPGAKRRRKERKDQQKAKKRTAGARSTRFRNILPDHDQQCCRNILPQHDQHDAGTSSWSTTKKKRRNRSTESEKTYCRSTNNKIQEYTAGARSSLRINILTGCHLKDTNIHPEKDRVDEIPPKNSLNLSNKETHY